MPFVKVETSVRHSKRLRRVSDRAGFVYFKGLTLAQECADDGFEVGTFQSSVGFFTIDELADDLYVERSRMRSILEELVDIGLWVIREDGCIMVARFEEQTTPRRSSSAERVRKHREQKALQRNASGNAPSNGENGVTQALRVTRRNVTVTQCNPVEQRSKNREVADATSVVTSVTTALGTEKSLEPPLLPESLPAMLPEEIEPLKRVAQKFLAAFGNAKSPDAQKKHGPDYVAALAIFRSRGASVADTWRAFCDAWLSQNGKPLFGASAKTAVAFLPPRDSKPIIGARRGVDDGSIDGLPYTVPEDQRA
jgi:hypothetical protein